MRKLGLDDEGVTELMAVVDLFCGFNNLLKGYQVEPDEKPTSPRGVDDEYSGHRDFRCRARWRSAAVGE